MSLLPLVLLTLGGFSSDPSYVRSRVNNAQEDATAHCLWWAQGTLNYSQSAAGNPDTPSAPQAVTNSWRTWQNQLGQCGNLTLTETAQSQSRAIGFAVDGGVNENVVIFRTVECANTVQASDPCHKDHTCGNKYDCWSDEYAQGIIALTTTTYDKNTGQLFDADVELNAGSFHFTANSGPQCPDNSPSSSCTAYDVQNTMTHEIGHVLGLAHSPDSDSTMYASAPLGETSKRQLDNGSLKYICDTYPKGAASRDCVVQAADLRVAKDGCSAAGSEWAMGGGAAALVIRSLLRFTRRKRG